MSDGYGHTPLPIDIIFGIKEHGAKAERCIYMHKYMRGVFYLPFQNFGLFLVIFRSYGQGV